MGFTETKFSTSSSQAQASAGICGDIAKWLPHPQCCLGAGGRCKRGSHLQVPVWLQATTSSTMEGDVGRWPTCAAALLVDSGRWPSRGHPCSLVPVPCAPLPPGSAAPLHLPSFPGGHRAPGSRFCPYPFLPPGMECHRPGGCTCSWTVKSAPRCATHQTCVGFLTAGRGAPKPSGRWWTPVSGIASPTDSSVPRLRFEFPVPCPRSLVHIAFQTGLLAVWSTDRSSSPDLAS